MAKEYAKAFYHSQEWKRCQADYYKRAGGLCERCLERGLIRPGVIVHHKVHITPSNIHDIKLLTDPHNLMLVCRDCHAALHKPEKRWKVDELGRITAL